MECRVIEKEDRVEVLQIESFVKKHSKSHFLQTPAWADVKACWKWRGIMACDEGELVGVMSVLIRTLPFGFSLMYAPRGPVCDRNDPYVMAALLHTADALAEAVHALAFLADPDELDSNSGFRQLMTAWDFREQQDTAFNNVQAQYVFRLYLLGETEESLLVRFCPKTRYNIRLAGRKGVQIVAYPGNAAIPDEALEDFDRIMRQTGERDRFVPRKKTYYRRVMDSLGAEAVMYFAMLDGEPIACTIGVYSGGKGWYLYGASSNERRDAMPNYLLQWEMIRAALDRGCMFYDFRGVPGDLSEDNPLYGLYRFKKGFGGVYTKFTGLFIKRYRPAAARGFEIALWVYQKVHTRLCCGRRKRAHRSAAKERAKHP